MSARLVSVSADSGTDIWAVGTQQHAQNVTTLVLHGDGSSWSQVDAVDPSGQDTVFNAVKALATDDVWAVGSYTKHAATVPLAEHWDGSTWTQIEAPPGTLTDSEFLAVDGIGPDDIWAVGTTWSSRDYSMTLVEHWDGTQWTTYPVNKEWEAQQLTGVAAMSPTDVWAVGYGLPEPDEGGYAPTTYHWNGTSWRRVVPDFDYIDADYYMRGVDSTPAGDFWAAGDSEDRGSPEQTHIARLHKRVWTPVDAPSHPAGTGTYVRSVSAVAADDVWMFGESHPSGQTRLFMLHWNGSRWGQVATPNPGGKAPAERVGASVSAFAADDVWAVGSWDSGSVVKPYVEHWDGATWTVALNGLPR